jgi:hypothetical protein
MLFKMIRIKVDGEKREEDGQNHDKRWEEMKTFCSRAQQAMLGMINHPS